MSADKIKQLIAWVVENKYPLMASVVIVAVLEGFFGASKAIEPIGKVGVLLAGLANYSIDAETASTIIFIFIAFINIQLATQAINDKIRNKCLKILRRDVSMTQAGISKLLNGEPISEAERRLVEKVKEELNVRVK